jgi:hypothetical protein
VSGILLIIGCGTTGSPNQEKPKSSIVGKWQVVVAFYQFDLNKAAANQTTPPLSPDEFESASFHISDRVIISRVKDKDVLSWGYELVPLEGKTGIDLLPTNPDKRQETRLEGLYEVSDTRLVLCVCMKSPGTRPTRIQFGGNDPLLLLILKRQP